MKFFLVTDLGELKVVIAKRYQPCSSPQNYDFHEEDGSYAGYYTVPNDVDVNPVEALKKAQRRIDRAIAATRRDIKDFHQRLKGKVAAHAMLETKDVSNVPFLPTYEEQEAARKAAEDAKRLEEQKRRKVVPKPSSDDGWDIRGLYDFFDPIYGQTTTVPTAPVYADPVASSQAVAMEVARESQRIGNREIRARERQSNIRDLQLAAEIAQQQQTRAASGSAPRRIHRPTPQPQYRGVLSQNGGEITHAPRNDQIPAAAIHDAVEAMDQSAIMAAPSYGMVIDFDIPREAASWPTRSPDTTQPALQPESQPEYPAFQNYSNTWAYWSPPTRSSLQSIVRRTN
jgi:hypothetical protein